MATDITTRSESGASFSIPSIIAIIAAAASWFVDAGWSILLAILALIFGIIGVVMAISPAKRGGVLSIVAIGLAALAIVVSIIALILEIF
jgi:hypothetical protein